MSQSEEVIALVNEFHGQMKLIFAQEEDPNLTAQRERWGPTLKRPLPLSPELGFPVDFFLLRSTELHQKEDKETEDLKNLVLRVFSNSQNEKVYGVAHASGSGKTRFAYALGTQNAHVVLIRLAFGTTLAPAFQELVRFIASVETALRDYCHLNGLNDRSSEEDISPHTKALRHYAQVALDAVRIFIFAHLEWLVCVVDKLHHLFQDNVDRQRRTMLQALGNGIGSSATRLIFLERVKMLQIQVPTEIRYQSSTPAEDFCLEMHNKLRSVMLGARWGPVVIAFDGIGASKNNFPGLWYQFGHYLKFETFRLQEFFTGLPSDNHQRAGDLYLAFCDIFRTLRLQYGFHTILLDADFSLFDNDDLTLRFSMRGGMISSTSGPFHHMSARDMYALIRRYFNVPESMPAELERELLIFEGRPASFVEHPLALFLERCASDRSQTSEDLIRLLVETAKEGLPRALKFSHEMVISAGNS